MPDPASVAFGHARVVVHSDVAAMARAAADQAADIMQAAVRERGVAHVMFATGNSQLEFIRALVTRTADVPWAETIVFHMDEYVGIGPDHPAGFQKWIRQRIVDPTSPRAGYYVDGQGDAESSSARYGELLARHPLDQCCLGIGENGHLAFNDPGVADFSDPLDVKVVELDTACRQQQVNEGHFPDMASSVPSPAITVTIPALLRAAAVSAVVPEARKAEPVRAALNGPFRLVAPPRPCGRSLSPPSTSSGSRPDCCSSEKSHPPGRRTSPKGTNRQRPHRDLSCPNRCGPPQWGGRGA